VAVQMSLSIGVKTDYSLLQSLIKIPDLIKYVLDNNYDTIGVLDDNLLILYSITGKII
jgi:DNA polymerase III alpha subunit